MIAAAIFLLVLLLMIILAIRERRKAAQYDHTQLPDADWSAKEYLGDGKWRDWYAPFDGLQLDAHERNHYEQAMIYRAAELLVQRRSGRWEGRHVTVTLHPGRDQETDMQADWLIRYGEQYGIHVRHVCVPVEDVKP